MVSKYILPSEPYVITEWSLAAFRNPFRSRDASEEPRHTFNVRTSRLPLAPFPPRQRPGVHAYLQRCILLWHSQGRRSVHVEGDSALQAECVVEMWRRHHARRLLRLGRPQRSGAPLPAARDTELRRSCTYSCIKWQNAVIQQLEGALLRYPHHIEGEVYHSEILWDPLRPSLLSPARICLHSLRADLQMQTHLCKSPGSPFYWRTATAGITRDGRLCEIL